MHVLRRIFFLSIKFFLFLGLTFHLLSFKIWVNFAAWKRFIIWLINCAFPQPNVRHFVHFTLFLFLLIKGFDSNILCYLQECFVQYCSGKKKKKTDINIIYLVIGYTRVATALQQSSLV